MGYARKIAMGFSEEAFMGGNRNVYTGSFDCINGQQDYDLQSICETISGSLVGQKKVLISRVFYKTGRAFWSLYGIYGGLSFVGNFLNYNSFSSETTFEMVPSWEMKARTAMIEDRLYTRTSHFSYELKNNKLRLYPAPINGFPQKIWFEFVIPNEGGNLPWVETDSSVTTGLNGVNNINLLPFANIPYEKINSIGKQWIREYCLACCKEILGLVRSKFQTIPIPNENITLNGSDLVSQAKEEKKQLRDELTKILEETQYFTLSKLNAGMVEDAENVIKKIPLGIYMI
jgi:hypothetical protein